MDCCAVQLSNGAGELPDPGRPTLARDSLGKASGLSSLSSYGDLDAMLVPNGGPVREILRTHLEYVVLNQLCLRFF